MLNLVFFICSEVKYFVVNLQRHKCKFAKLKGPTYSTHPKTSRLQIACHTEIPNVSKNNTTNMPGDQAGLSFYDRRFKSLAQIFATHMPAGKHSIS